MAVSASRVGSGAASGAAAGTAILPGWGTAIGAVGGALMGALSGDDGSAAASDAMNKAIAQYDAMGIPPDLSKPILYQQLQQGGKLTPELEQALTTDNFQPGQVKDNNDTRAQLTSALQGIRSKSFGGLSPEQMANQQKLLQQANANTESQYKGILQGQQARGQAGSGDSLAAMLNAAQGGAQQTSQNALQIGAQGSQAQNTALQQYLAGLSQLRGQDTARDTTNATLQQQANMYKAQNSSSRQARNVGADNQAQQYNVGRQNQVSDYNTQLANQESLREQEAKRQNWLDQLSLAGAKSNAYLGQASALTQQAQNSNQNFNNITQGVGSIGAAYGQYNKNNPSASSSSGSTGSNNPVGSAPTLGSPGTYSSDLNADDFTFN